MSCEKFGILISKWVDGEARAEEIRTVEAHVAECPFCRKLAEDFRRTSALVDAAFAGEPIGQRVARRVLSTIERRRTAIRWGVRVATAAALLLTFLIWRADRAAERREFARTVEAAMAVVKQMEASLTAERARPAEIVREIVREPVFVYLPAGSMPAPDAAQPSDVAKDGSAPLDPSPERSGTIALDRVDALADGDTGFVSLAWKMNCSPAAVYFVHRRLAGEESFGDPINSSGLLTPEFEDTSAQGLTTYEYMVVAITPTGPVPSNVVARVTTPADLRIEFKGLGTVNDRPAPMFGVSTRTQGVWSEPITWFPEAGERYGATGVYFKTCSKEMRPYTRHVERFENGRRVIRPETYFISELRATLSTASGEIRLWNGSRVEGSRDRLDVQLQAK